MMSAIRRNKASESGTSPACNCLNSVKLALLMVSVLNVTLSAAQTPRKPKELNQNCTNHLQTIDRCSSLATYSYTTDFNQYPLNATEMKASCARITQGLNCLKANGKCLSPLSRRSLTAFSGSRSRHSKRLCSNLNDPKATEFWQAGECIVNNGKGSLMVESEKKLISTIQLLATTSNLKWENRFHLACCAASDYRIKVMKDIEPECKKFKDTIEDMLNSMVGELLDSACPEQQRLKEICLKQPRLTLDKEWKPESLTRAALDLIIKLSDNKD